MHATNPLILRNTLNAIEALLPKERPGTQGPNFVDRVIISDYLLWAADASTQAPGQDTLAALAARFGGPVAADQSLPLDITVRVRKHDRGIDITHDSVDWLKQLLTLLDHPRFHGIPLPCADMLDAPYGELSLYQRAYGRSRLHRLRRNVIEELLESGDHPEPEEVLSQSGLYAAAADPTVSAEVTEFALEQVRLLCTRPEFGYPAHPGHQSDLNPEIAAIDTAHPGWRCVDFYRQTAWSAVVDQIKAAGVPTIDTRTFPLADPLEYGVWQTPWGFNDRRTVSHYHRLAEITAVIDDPDTDPRLTMSLLEQLPGLRNPPAAAVDLITTPGTTMGVSGFTFSGDNKITEVSYHVQNPEVEKTIDITWQRGARGKRFTTYSTDAHLFATDLDLGAVVESAGQDPFIAECESIVSALQRLARACGLNPHPHDRPWTVELNRWRQDEHRLVLSTIKPHRGEGLEVSLKRDPQSQELDVFATLPLGLGCRYIDTATLCARIEEALFIQELASSYTTASPEDYAYLHWPTAFLDRIAKPESTGLPYLSRINAVAWCMACNKELDDHDTPSNRESGPLSYYHDPVTGVLLGKICSQCYCDQQKNPQRWLPWFTGKAPWSATTWKGEDHWIYTGGSKYTPLGTFLYLAGKNAPDQEWTPSEGARRVRVLQERIHQARISSGRIFDHDAVVTNVDVELGQYFPFPGDDAYDIVTHPLG